MEAQCTVSVMLQSQCHLKTYSKALGIHEIVDLDPETREIVMWRANLTMLNLNATVCLHHKYLLLNRYPMQQRACCNPFKLHLSVKKGKKVAVSY